jgi:four helix bundle protein
MDLVVEVYRATEVFPNEERYGLTAQLRRASVSIASNIAEGKGRTSDRELLHFLSNAKGSLFEVETQVMIAVRLGYLPDTQSVELLARAAEAGRILNGLMKSFRTEQIS